MGGRERGGSETEHGEDKQLATRRHGERGMSGRSERRTSGTVRTE